MGKLPFDRESILGLLINSMRRRFITLKIKSKIEISIQEVLHDKLVPITNNNDGYKFNDIQVNQILSRFYKRNESDKFISTNEIKFKNPFFWENVYDHLTHNSMLINN